MLPKAQLQFLKVSKTVPVPIIIPNNKYLVLSLKNKNKYNIAIIKILPIHLGAKKVA